MKKYKFKACTSRGSMIMGLAFPASFMVSILAIYLTLFYLRILHQLKGKTLLLFAIFLPALLISYIIINKIRNKCCIEFTVCLDKLRIIVMKNENEILKGRVLSCNLKAATSRLVRLDIVTEEGKISFRAVPKKYKTITGNTSFNPFGISDEYDMEKLAELGREIKYYLDN